MLVNTKFISVATTPGIHLSSEFDRDFILENSYRHGADLVYRHLESGGREPGEFGGLGWVVPMYSVGT